VKFVTINRCCDYILRLIEVNSEQFPLKLSHERHKTYFSMGS